MVVFKVFWVIFLDSKIQWSTRSHWLTIRSQAPPWCGALSVLNVHLTPRCKSECKSEALSQLLRKWCHCKSEALFQVLCLEIKRWMATNHELMSMYAITSIWVVRFVIIKPQRFSDAWWALTWEVPKVKYTVREWRLAVTQALQEKDRRFCFNDFCFSLSTTLCMRDKTYVVFLIIF